ncbi:LysE family translocator [Comamonas sediminis]|uniref:LysE family translocator n=1 Tax=Comamonas sediminis TaxID=1783360 RepID=UPI003D2A838D
MVEPHQLLMFIAAGWLLNLTPGPDVFYMLSHAARQGWRAGLVASAGITAGCMVHVTAAALGVGALLAASATAFGVLKWLGAAYLLWMGLQMLRSKNNSKPLSPAGNEMALAEPGTRLARIFWGGFWTNVLNPKVAIFFLAFIPQFIAADYAHKSLAFAALGLLFNLNAIPVNMLWVGMGAGMARRAGGLRQRLHWLDRAAGAMFIGFGLKLALTDKPGA